MTRYKNFQLSEIFDIKLGKPYFKQQLIIGNSGIPYITRIGIGNGMQGKIAEDFAVDRGLIVNDSNCITIGAEGLKAFYQPVDFITGNKVSILRNKNLNNLNSIYLIIILNKSMSKIFSYGRAAVMGRLNPLKIPLPVDDLDNPDWQFMEDYIKQFEETKLLEIQETDYKDNVKLPSVDEWGSFRLGELFTISRGRLAKKPSDIGEVPYISSSGMNNGLNKSFNIDSKYIVRANLSPVITVANNGSVGSTFVQEFAFSASSDVSILEPIFDSNTDALFFIKVIIERNKNLYGYGRKWGLEKMRSSIIKLPTLENGEPDWILIERYMRSLPYSEII